MIHTDEQLRRVKAMDYQQTTGDECRRCGIREVHYNVYDCTRALSSVVSMMAANVSPERGLSSIAALRDCIAELDVKIYGKGGKK